VQQTLSSLRIDKWKRGSVRYEAGEEIDQILHDMQTNLPPLLREADAAPGTLSKILPVARHIDALYDVLLRVVEAARIAAPQEQASQARQALTNLEQARVAFDDRIQEQAVSQERQIGDLHETVQREAARKCPVPSITAAPQSGQSTVKKPGHRRPQSTTAPGQKPAATPGQKPSGSTSGAKPSTSAPGGKSAAPANGTPKASSPGNGKTAAPAAAARNPAATNSK